MDSPLRTTTSGLLERCRAWLRRYLVLSDPQQIVVAVWVLHTWAIEAADCTPYLHVTAPEKGCGKTRLLEVLRPIVCRPWLTGRVTAGALVRKIDKDKPTLLLDESDAAFKGDVIYTEALRGILNSGFTRNGYSSMCVGKSTERSTQDFVCFGPKAIAGIGELPDTVASRSIVIAMRRKTAAESVERFRERDVKMPAEELRAALEVWATAEVIERLHGARPHLPEQMTDRQQDISEPLLVIADAAGGSWPDVVRSALLELFGSVVSEDASVRIQLLQDIRGIFDEQGTPAICSADIAKALCRMEGQPWAEQRNGNGLNPSGLARLLKVHCIAPRMIRFVEGTQRGYYRYSFQDAWDRYCPAVALRAVTGVTAVTSRVNIDDSEPILAKQGLYTASTGRNNGPFAAQGSSRAVMGSTCNTQIRPDAEDPRHSPDVTAVTPVTASQGAALTWHEIGNLEEVQ